MSNCRHIIIQFITNQIHPTFLSYNVNILLQFQHTFLRKTIQPLLLTIESVSCVIMMLLNNIKLYQMVSAFYPTHSFFTAFISFILKNKVEDWWKKKKRFLIINQMKKVANRSGHNETLTHKIKACLLLNFSKLGCLFAHHISFLLYFLFCLRLSIIIRNIFFYFLS